MLDRFIVTEHFSKHSSIPTSFGNGVTLAEEVGMLATYVNSLYSQYVETNGSLNDLTASYNQLISSINAYKIQLDNFISGNTIPDGSITLEKLSSDIMVILKSWIDEYLYHLHTFVSFGLEGDYFVVYIPDSWHDIKFTTDVEGHLILEF